jgi:hypothetical protein
VAQTPLWTAGLQRKKSIDELAKNEARFVTFANAGIAMNVFL